MKTEKCFEKHVLLVTFLLNLVGHLLSTLQPESRVCYFFWKQWAIKQLSRKILVDNRSNPQYLYLSSRLDEVSIILQSYCSISLRSLTDPIWIWSRFSFDANCGFSAGKKTIWPENKVFPLKNPVFRLKNTDFRPTNPVFRQKNPVFWQKNPVFWQKNPVFPLKSLDFRRGRH